MIEDLVINESRLFTCGKQPEKPEKEKCFIYKHGKCALLRRGIKKDCETCPFFKTQEQYERGREGALERLKTLDETTRRNIAEKYQMSMKSLDVPRQSIDRGL